MKLSLVLFSLLMFPSSALAAGGTFGAGGDGSSESEAILVEDCLDLDALDNKTEHYRFANDITNCASVNFQGADNFKGVIDGDGYSILGYTGSSHNNNEVFFDFGGEALDLSLYVDLPSQGGLSIPGFFTASGDVTTHYHNINYDVVVRDVANSEFFSGPGAVKNLSGFISDSRAHISYLGSGMIFPNVAYLLGSESSSSGANIVSSEASVYFSPDISNGAGGMIYFNDTLAASGALVSNSRYYDCGLQCLPTPISDAFVFASSGNVLDFGILAIALNLDDALVDDGNFASYINRLTSVTSGNLSNSRNDHYALTLLRESAKIADYGGVFFRYSSLFQSTLEALVGSTAYDALTNSSLSAFVDVISDWRYLNR